MCDFVREPYIYKAHKALKTRGRKSSYSRRYIILYIKGHRIILNLWVF